MPSSTTRKRFHCKEPDLISQLLDVVRAAFRGLAHGVDYLRIRADGRIELDLHVTVETDDGRRIALSGDGQAAARKDEPLMDIFANIRLSTAAKEYAWVNARQIWAVADREPGYWEDARRGIHAMKAISFE
jgi:hypothetical protein